MSAVLFCFILDIVLSVKKKKKKIVDNKKKKRRSGAEYQNKLVANEQLGKARQGKFIYIAHFIHSGNSKCFT